MPKDQLSPERFRSRSTRVGVTREGEINFTSASSLHTPDDLHPERLCCRGDKQADLNDTQLNLRVDRIKQRLFQVTVKAMLRRAWPTLCDSCWPCCLQSSPDSQRSKTHAQPSDSNRHRPHHFCIEHSQNSSLPHKASSEQSVTSTHSAPDRHTFNSTEPEQKGPDSFASTQDSARDNPPDLIYKTYNMASVKKLLAELAHKQQECRKMKQQAAVSPVHVWQPVFHGYFALHSLV